MISTHPRPVIAPDKSGLAQAWEIESIRPLRSSLEPEMTRGFEQIYFRTESGNLYSIQLSKEVGEWTIANSTNGRVDILTLQDLEEGILELGKPFVYGNNATTSNVTQIVALSGSYFYVGTPDLKTVMELAIKHSSGNISFIKEEFGEKFESASKQLP